MGIFGRVFLPAFPGLKNEICRTNFPQALDNRTFVRYNINREDISSYHNRIVWTVLLKNGCHWRAKTPCFYRARIGRLLHFEFQSRLHKVQHKTWTREPAPVFCATYVGVFFCPKKHNWIPARCPNPRWPFPKETSVRRCNATEPHSVHRGGVPTKSKDFLGEGGATKRWAFHARAKTISEGRDDAPVGRAAEQEETTSKGANVP